MTWVLYNVLEGTQTNEGPHLSLGFIAVNLRLAETITVVDTSLICPSSLGFPRPATAALPGPAPSTQLRSHDVLNQRCCCSVAKS